MALVTSNALVKGLSGMLGGALVFRTYRGKTFVSTAARNPDRKKETQAQRATRVTFQQASEWASAMMLNPDKKAYYKQRAKALKLPNAYTAALTDYMRKSKVIKTQQRDSIRYRINKPGFTIQNVTVETAGVQTEIVTRKQNDAWIIDYTPTNNIASLLVVIITDAVGRTTTLLI